MFYKGINTKVFRRSIAFAIAVVVTSRSSSFENTISVHAVRASSERNACNIVAKYTSSIFWPVDKTWYLICSASAQKAELKVVGVL